MRGRNPWSESLGHFYPIMDMLDFIKIRRFLFQNSLHSVHATCKIPLSSDETLASCFQPKSEEDSEKVFMDSVARKTSHGHEVKTARKCAWGNSVA